MKKKTLFFSSAGILILLKILISNVRDKYYSNRSAERVNAINRTMFKWISNNVNSDYFREYFRKRRIETIGIYGTASLGELLYYALKGTGIEIAYFMDKANDEDADRFDGIPMYRTGYEGELPMVDAVVVTPVFFFDDIKDDLMKNNVPTKKIISLEQIVS